MSCTDGLNAVLVRLLRDRGDPVVNMFVCLRLKVEEFVC